ncbi:MAG TPA: SRPBCC family protein [Verrucomicrobiae bacterium]|nr:SRPBCC family protein [Verrucomicrobiae bacterium]
MLPILLALAFIAVIFIIAIAGQPDEFVVSRSVKISAPPENVFPHVNDLHKWQAWSPWAKLDPNAKNTFEGPTAGVGSSMAWVRNNKVGAGKMTITDSKPVEVVRFRLDFLKPMKATNTAEFTFRAEGGQTSVNWTMIGQGCLMGKVFGLLMNCEKMCGDQFLQGLANLKKVAESR